MISKALGLGLMIMADVIMHVSSKLYVYKEAMINGRNRSTCRCRIQRPA